MKVIAFSGSPHKRGNVARLIKLLSFEIGAFGKFEILPSLNIAPCKECHACKKTGFCIIKSDQWGGVAKSMLKSNLIIIGSPVYFYDMSGSLKMFLDRTYSLWHKRQLKGKKIIVCIVGSHGAKEALDTLCLWAQAHEMKIIATITSTYDKPRGIEKDKNVRQEVKKIKKQFK